VTAGTEKCNTIIIEYDCDGNCSRITKQIKNILGQEYQNNNIYLLGIEFEIEEWICDSLKIKYSAKRRPAKALNDFEKEHAGKYRKDKLPSYSSKMDYNRLSKNKSFQAFLRLMEK
jgi:ribulose bisphosphate carboxylase small subunit